jgi:hypothetical protein
MSHKIHDVGAANHSGGTATPSNDDVAVNGE